VSSLQILPTSLLDQFEAARVTTSFVVDAAGASINSSGNSKGLGNETDLELLRALRAQAEVVLTSGLTARLENYRMPRHADLAIFTRAGVRGLDLKPRAGQKLQLLTPPVINSYQAALDTVNQKYQSVHVEFGLTGVKELAKSIDLFVISSQHPGGAALFLDELQVPGVEEFELSGLFITLALGRG
jgi:hypothetical protein